MRMNLNQQSYGKTWKPTEPALLHLPHCRLWGALCGCDVPNDGAKPIRVSGLGAQLTDELPADKINYGHLQVTFEDGSVGWYEAGWGPMMSETAFFVKDVVGPQEVPALWQQMHPPGENHLRSMPIPKPKESWFTVPKRMKKESLNSQMSTLIWTTNQITTNFAKENSNSS